MMSGAALRSNGIRKRQWEALKHSLNSLKIHVNTVAVITKGQKSFAFLERGWSATSKGKQGQTRQQQGAL